MLRQQISGKIKESKDQISWRGHEVTRVEAFSDAVFAFALTLLIMSLEVPKTYEELIKALNFFVPFGICFAITFMVWYRQNIFFRRYGLQDILTIVLNGMLMFFVLVYMFPLKFLIGGVFSQDFHVENMHQAANIFRLYSAGFAVFYLLFALMVVTLSMICMQFKRIS